MRHTGIILLGLASGCVGSESPKNLDALCTMAQTIEADENIDNKGQELALRFTESQLVGDYGLRDAVLAVATADPAHKSKPIFDLAKKRGMDRWSCPAIEAAWGPP